MRESEQREEDQCAGMLFLAMASTVASESLRRFPLSALGLWHFATPSFRDSSDAEAGSRISALEEGFLLLSDGTRTGLVSIDETGTKTGIRKRGNRWEG
jgi:hypothetical protein